MFYILDKNGEAVLATSAMDWAIWFDKADRKLRVDDVNINVRVSTVFLGVDHGFGNGAPPLLYETMVFGGVMDQEMRRYATKAEALAGHEEMLAEVKRRCS